MAVTHLLPDPDVPADVWLSDDPDLALVHADLNAWADAHPCKCEAMCVCRCCGDPGDCHEDCA